MWPFQVSKQVESQADQQALVENNEEINTKYKYAPQPRDEEAPMDLGTLQDVFSFSFMKGRPILNFVLAVLWSIGLPILLYHLIKPYTGQVLGMIVASAPPLCMVLVRMISDRKFDLLGCIAGVSFLITGILSIAEPDEKTAAICESLVSLLVGIICLVSVLPIQIGSFKLRPVVYQLANQVMPRDETMVAQDDQRLTSTPSGRKRLDYLYTHMAKFRHDMRFMTVTWGLLLIVAFVVKVVMVMTSTDTSKAQWYGYLLFGLIACCMAVFTWVYTNLVKGHVVDQVAFWRKEQEVKHDAEGVQNINWVASSMYGGFEQVLPM
ncbi:uncharacterized protein B0P05DRAFT_548919 [Gilbertella persicaria]|uniref:uncharacterized protein n=1 Tax=Gilbertella persicaria TaxID=101096 RepID=UPI002220EA07|nr:uncharacterized protein B0P05DRAFT_548919 [Gilbertella persicaria]KAI8073519.1 hypothetical protein B0P05DRAFT_548919 [Gilbertella persicaria]